MKAPLPVTKQLGLQQLGGQGGDVDRDEGLSRARRVRVEDAGHDLLAAARLAQDNHRRVAAREARRALEHSRIAALRATTCAEPFNSDPRGRETADLAKPFA